MIYLMTVPRREPGDERSDAAIMAEHIVAANVLEELDGTMRFAGEGFLLFLGAHADDGFCWCQPQKVPCASGRAHEHMSHQDPVH